MGADLSKECKHYLFLYEPWKNDFTGPCYKFKDGRCGMVKFFPQDFKENCCYANKEKWDSKKVLSNIHP